MKTKEAKLQRKYSKQELAFIITMSIFLALIVGGVIAVLVVETTHTTPCGGSIQNASPAPIPEKPKF